MIAHADELSPARKKNVIEHADQARQSKELATMRRDLELNCDVTQLVLSAPDRSELKEIFRKFEFRNVLHRVDELDAAVPAAPMLLEKTAVPWSEELSNSLLHGGEVAIAAEDDRIAVAVPERVAVSPRPPRLEGELIVHDAKAQRVPAKDDTLLLAYLIEPSRPEYPLGELEAEYGLELEPDPPAEEETAALVRNAAATLRLRDLLLDRVRERGMEPLYRDVELPLSPVLAAMEDTGVKIDEYRMGELPRACGRWSRSSSRGPTTSRARNSCSARRRRSAGSCSRSSASPPVGRARPASPTDTRVLRTIRGEHEIVGVIEEWREYSKLLNTYLGPLPSLIAEDGRLHTTINQAVAATGRLSTTNPNLQAIPIRTALGREIRSAFIAEPGNKLLSADYSQIELRILAHVSGEPKLREAFERGEDIHTATAVEVLGVEPADLTSAQRSVAKMINFGIVYGISSFGLSENLEIPREEAQQYIDAYLARFPHVQDFIRRTIEQSERDGYATSLLGRRRPVQELRAQNRQTRSLGERLAVNFVMQGSNADIIKVAMVRIHDRLRAEGRGARLVLQVHDELLLEVPEAEVSAVKELVREEMVGAYDLDPPLAVDVGTGDDWSEAKS